MQQRFLTLVQDLQQPRQLTGLWLAHSDEPLVLQWLIDACRPHWQANQQVIKRLELNTAKDWQLAINDLQSLSLFDDSFAIVVTGKHKPDHATIDRLLQFADDAKNGDNSHHLIWLLPKQDKKSQSNKAFIAFANAGTVIDANLYQESDRHAILKFQAKQLGIGLTTNAWQILFEQTEQDLLTAHQNLWQLSLLYPDNQALDETALLPILTQGGSFSVFDLSDALIQQNPKKARQILQHLQQIDTAPTLVLWAIAKEVRLLANLKAGKNPETLGIWRNKITNYQRLAHRIEHRQIHLWLTLIYQAEQSVKGLLKLDSWQLFHQLCLHICHTPALKPVSTT